MATGSRPRRTSRDSPVMARPGTGGPSRHQTGRSRAPGRSSRGCCRAGTAPTSAGWTPRRASTPACRRWRRCSTDTAWRPPGWWRTPPTSDPSSVSGEGSISMTAGSWGGPWQSRRHRTIWRLGRCPSWPTTCQCGSRPSTGQPRRSQPRASRCCAISRARAAPSCCSSTSWTRTRRSSHRKESGRSSPRDIGALAG
jgi:hypothetical protein